MKLGCSSDRALAGPLSSTFVASRSQETLQILKTINVGTDQTGSWLLQFRRRLT